MWSGVGSIPQTIEECDKRLRLNFEGATVERNGELLVWKGEIVDKAAWKERVKVVFDRKKEYHNKWVMNYTRDKLEQA